MGTSTAATGWCVCVFVCLVVWLFGCAAAWLFASVWFSSVQLDFVYFVRFRLIWFGSVLLWLGCGLWVVGGWLVGGLVRAQASPPPPPQDPSSLWETGPALVTAAVPELSPVDPH